MSAKTAYNFNPETGEYIGSEPAIKNPLEVGKYLLPANATFTEPPKAKTGEAAIWSTDAWSIQTDQRGKEYWLADGSHHIIENIGEVVPGNALNAALPPSLETVKHQALTLIAKPSCPGTERPHWQRHAGRTRYLEHKV